MDAALATIYGAAIGAVAALLGTILALVFEPLKLRLAHSHERQMLRNAVYKELWLIYIKLSALKQAPPDENLHHIGLRLDMVSISFDCYNYAKTKPELFYGMEEAVEIETVYNILSSFPRFRSEIEQIAIKTAGNDHLDSDQLQQASIALVSVLKILANNACVYIEESAQKGRLDKKLLFRH